MFWSPSLSISVISLTILCRATLIYSVSLLVSLVLSELLLLVLSVAECEVLK